MTHLLREREIKIGQNLTEADQSLTDTKRKSVEKEKDSIVGSEGMSGKESPGKEQKQVYSTNSESEWWERDTYESFLPYRIAAGKKADIKYKKTDTKKTRGGIVTNGMVGLNKLIQDYRKNTNKEGQEDDNPTPNIDEVPIVDNGGHHILTTTAGGTLDETNDKTGTKESNQKESMEIDSSSRETVTSEVVIKKEIIETATKNILGNYTEYEISSIENSSMGSNDESNVSWESEQPATEVPKQDTRDVVNNLPKLYKRKILLTNVQQQ